MPVDFMKANDNVMDQAERMELAAGFMQALIYAVASRSPGALDQHTLAREAYDLADAFIDETKRRLPQDEAQA